MEDEFLADRRTSAQRLADMEERLEHRSRLIENLTYQLENYVHQEKLYADQRQSERETYRKKFENFKLV